MCVWRDRREKQEPIFSRLNASPSFQALYYTNGHAQSDLGTQFAHAKLLQGQRQAEGRAGRQAGRQVSCYSRCVSTGLVTSFTPCNDCYRARMNTNLVSQSKQLCGLLASTTPCCAVGG